MNKTYDAVVAGAGPAGSSAARTLARGGLSVALLDKASFPRPKLCGGLLTWKTREFLARNFDLTEAELAPAVQYRTHRYAILFKDRILSQGRSPEPFVLADRGVLDGLLVERAQEAGAVLVEQAAVRHSSPETGEVATTEGRVFQGRVLLGCDGVSSRVRRSLPLAREDRRAWNQGMARALECRVPRQEAPAELCDLDHPRLHLGFVRAGYGWVFPFRDHVVVGQCGLADPARPFRVSLAEFLEHLGLAPADLASGGLKMEGHPLPYGNHLARPGFGRTLLCGDAAGLVEPTLGEGIFYALHSGRHAARACLDALAANPDDPEPLPGYMARLGRDVLPELTASNRMRWALLGLVERFGVWPLRFFTALPKRRLAEMVHGLRSYSRLKRKRWDF